MSTKTTHYSPPPPASAAAAAVAAPRLSGGAVVTHDGIFHADEVAAIAFYTLGYGTPTIVRTRDEERLAYYKQTARTYRGSVMIFDVGKEYDPENNIFDHHMDGFREYFSDEYRQESTTSGSPSSFNRSGVQCWMSSFGMFYKQHGLTILDNYFRQRGKLIPHHHIMELWKVLYARMVSCIDYADNTGMRHPLEASFPALTFICGMCSRVYRADSRDTNEGFLRVLAIFREVISVSIDFLWREHSMRASDEENIEHITTLVRNAASVSGSRGVFSAKYIVVDRRDRPIWTTVKRISPDIGYIIVIHPGEKACLHCGYGLPNIDKDLCESSRHKGSVCNYSIPRRQAFFDSLPGAIAYLSDLADLTERRVMEHADDPDPSLRQAGRKREREEEADIGRESIPLSDGAGGDPYPSMSPSSQFALPSPLEPEAEQKEESGGPHPAIFPSTSQHISSLSPEAAGSSSAPPEMDAPPETDDCLYGFFGPYG